MEQGVFIPAGDLALEGLIQDGDPERGGVVLHPHPLYGGSMHNNVVAAAVRALTRAGWTSLRFNFRGVGQSGGTYDHGRGERDDLVAAVSYLRERGATRLTVVGYSFGAWTAAFAWPRLRDLGVQPLILIAPPAAFMSFDALPSDTAVRLIVSGSDDDFGPPEAVQAVGRRLANPVTPLILKGVDHFFGGRENELTQILFDHLNGA